MKSKKQILVALIVMVPGVIILLVVGIFLFASATAVPLHRNPADVSAVTEANPTATWSSAVEEGRQLIRAGIVEQNLPGVSVAVGIGDELVWAEGFGWADLEHHLPVKPDTRFRIGTASMMLTSAGVGLLIEKGQLQLDQKIQTYVPEYPEKKWPVTLRQLMAHAGGVRRDAGDEEPVTQRCHKTIEGVHRFMRHDLSYEPGTEFRLTTYGWMLVSAAVDAVAQEPFFTFMRKQVFEPLQMNHTSASGDPAPDRAVYYFPRFAADPRYGPQDPSEVDYTCFSGASAFLSTPTDLVRFGMAMNNGRLLKPATVQQLQAPQRLSTGAETGYGLGWDLETVTLAGTQTTLVGHDGELRGGMVGSLMTFPERGLVVSVLSNTSFADTYSLGLKVAGVFAAVKAGRTR